MRTDCTTGKICYSEKKRAEGIARKLDKDPHNPLVAYYCDDCGLWHIGHLGKRRWSAELRRGKK